MIFARVIFKESIAFQIMGIIVILLILVMIIKLKKFSAQRTVSGTAKEQRRFEKVGAHFFL